MTFPVFPPFCQERHHSCCSHGCPMAALHRTPRKLWASGCMQPGVCKHATRSRDEDRAARIPGNVGHDSGPMAPHEAVPVSLGSLDGRQCAS